MAQAIGQAAIQQGYSVLYRETHMLLEELAEAVADGTRKQYMESVATVPLLIIDDFGMRKLPHTAAEDLLEIIMRRYERASTLLTSNRPVDDWGKLLGDVAAVSAMLDRLLHHGHVLKCGPRSWRTKTAGRTINKERSFFDARALPSRSRDLSLCARMAGGAAAPPRIPAAGRRSGRIPALPYPPPRCGQYRTGIDQNAKINLPARRPARYNLMLVLPHFRWPVLRCPSLAGFQVSPEGQEARASSTHVAGGIAAHWRAASAEAPP